MTLGRNLLYFVCGVTVLLCGCKRQHSPTPRYHFKTNILVRHTPVKAQGQWPVGWIYATVGLIESDRIRVGDSIVLSETYLLRKYAEEQVRSQGKLSSFSGNPLSCLHLIERQGILTYRCFRPQLAMTFVTFSHTVNAANLHTVCDTGFAYLPPSIGLYGAVYTPHDLAQSLFLHRQYEGFTSFPDGPPSGTIRLRLPGDSLPESYTNLSASALLRLIRSTLQSGRALVWMGDTTATSYSTSAGYAFCPAADIQQTCSLAQIQNGKLRIAPHCMLLVGMADIVGNRPDDSSERFFICKDSQGHDGPYGGYLYLSENYLRHYTLAVYRHI